MSDATINRALSATGTEIITAILTGKADDSLISVIDAVRTRRSVIRAQGRAITMMTLKVGDTVVLKGLNPKYINGSKAEVVGKNRSRVQVRITVPSDPRVMSRFDGVVTVPAECLNAA